MKSGFEIISIVIGSLVLLCLAWYLGWRTGIKDRQYEKKIIKKIIPSIKVRRSDKTVIKKLSPRQIEVINLISKGFTSQEIAKQLFISVETVRTHRMNIMRRTGCKTTGELAARFARGELKV